MKLRKFSPLFIFTLLFGVLSSCGEKNTFPNDYLSPDEVVFKDKMQNMKQIGEIEGFRKSYCPSTGDVNVLVLPVAFLDSSADTDLVLNDIELAFNGTKEDTGWESVNTYFLKSSYGHLNLTATVPDEWFQYDELSMTVSNSGYYTADILDKGFEWYKETYNSNGKEFDSDSDGFIDAVIMVYAAEDYATNPYYGTNFWAYTYWDGYDIHGDYNFPVPNSYIWASYIFMYPEGHGSELINIDAHTFIHELGHCFGLNDYYNYDDESGEKGYQPAGGFDMQDCNVGDHNAYSKMVLGWTKPYVVDKTCEITLTSSALNENQCIIIPAGGVNRWNQSPFDEYILLEFYTPQGCNEFDATHVTYKGYPRGTTTVGIKAWHVDSRLYQYERNGWKQIGYTDEIANTRKYYYEIAATNTTKGAPGYCTSIKEALYFKQLHMLSATGDNVTRNRGRFTSDDVFTKGKAFDMDTFASSFYYRGYMNEVYKGSHKEKLGFRFRVMSVDSTSCTVKIIKD